MGLHLSPEEAGTVFSKVQPKLAVYSHIVMFGVSDDELTARTRKIYAGPLVVGTDRCRSTSPMWSPPRGGRPRSDEGSQLEIHFATDRYYAWRSKSHRSEAFDIIAATAAVPDTTGARLGSYELVSGFSRRGRPMPVPARCARQAQRSRVMRQGASHKPTTSPCR